MSYVQQLDVCTYVTACGIWIAFRIYILCPLRPYETWIFDHSLVLKAVMAAERAGQLTGKTPK